MVRHRSSHSSKWKFLNPAYYLRRPRRLAVLCILFVCTTVVVWDRQTLSREHEAEISKLTEERDQLQSQLKKLADYLENIEKRKLQVETGFQSYVDDKVSIERRNHVKEAMVHAWASYEKYAWGFDELQPQSKSGVNNFGGLGASIIDSLDTLYIMGLDEQFQKAKEWVASSLDFNRDVDASVFETTIRVVGGLLSAYDLSEDGIFLQKAQEIADRLLPAWDTPSGIPYNAINLAYGNPHNPGWTGGASILADSGTEQLEFIALSQRSGDRKYQEKAENVVKKLQESFPDDGLLPIYINPQSGQAETYSKITFGAMGDSFYEYLLKVWIQGNRTDAVKLYRDMWEKSMKGLSSLIKKSTPSAFTYITERSGGALIDKMDELACFTPGMLALGAFNVDSDEARSYLSLAEEDIVQNRTYNHQVMEHCFTIRLGPSSCIMFIITCILRLAFLNQ
eukprot:TRINITY_DN1853_c0_g1_i2.p1 TRINITY_DN1853_c0_g1~~TRINITY_DN1853_c0_g1_i2.p1  ORF type:complete len:452 (+),score=88.24 TRINITY_DN1853_c0_g1_i2:187-1542(+)